MKVAMSKRIRRDGNGYCEDRQPDDAATRAELCVRPDSASPAAARCSVQPASDLEPRTFRGAIGRCAHAARHPSRRQRPRGDQMDPGREFRQLCPRYPAAAHHPANDRAQPVFRRRRSMAAPEKDLCAILLAPGAGGVFAGDAGGRRQAGGASAWPLRWGGRPRPRDGRGGRRCVVPDAFGNGLGEHESSIAASVRRFADATGAVALGDLLKLPAWVPDIRRLVGWRAIRTVRKRARRIVADARRSPESGDIVSALLQARDADTGRTLGARIIEDNVSTLIGAGSDTVAIALTWAIFLLSETPEIRAKVEAELDACLKAGPITLETRVRFILVSETIE